MCSLKIPQCVWNSVIVTETPAPGCCPQPVSPNLASQGQEEDITDAATLLTVGPPADSKPLSAGGEQGLQASNPYVPWPLAASSDGGLGTIDAAGQAPGP